VLLALVLILVYITIRFEFRFAVAAIVALVHDVLITLGAFSAANHEISLAVIAAFLTIVGYSLNDTIVVLDRVRETFDAYRGRDMKELLNRAINNTLSRTVLTSLTTFAGLTPMLRETSVSAQFLIPMATSLGFGVLFGSAISLVLVPSLYLVGEDLRQLQEPEPMHTGIPSLDSLNRKWDVLQMVRVFPDISPDDKIAARYGLAGIYKLVVPEGTDLAAMIRDYQADPHVDYAELNQPFEAK